MATLPFVNRLFVVMSVAWMSVACEARTVNVLYRVSACRFSAQLSFERADNEIAVQLRGYGDC